MRASPWCASSSRARRSQYSAPPSSLSRWAAYPAHAAASAESGCAVIEEAFPEQRAPHLEHQVVVVSKAEGHDAVEAPYRARAVAELEEHLAQAREGVLVVRVETDRLLERATRPQVLLAGEARVPHAHVQLHRVGVETEAFTQDLDRFVVVSFVVELMRAFVVVVGAEERFRHRTGLPGRLRYDKKPRTVSQATRAGYLDRRCSTPCPTDR